VKALESNYILPKRGEYIAEDQDASGDLPLQLGIVEMYRFRWDLKVGRDNIGMDGI
jgi:hypothetical protein